MPEEVEELGLRDDLGALLDGLLDLGQTQQIARAEGPGLSQPASRSLSADKIPLDAPVRCW